MKNTINRVNHHINEIANLFNVGHTLNGRFKLLFANANNMPDSDGNSIIDTYLVPLDKAAFESVQKDDHSQKDNQSFLHLQILGSMIPSEFLGYEYDFQVEDKLGGEINEVNSYVCNVDWRNNQFEKYLFNILNNNDAVSESA